MRKRKEKKINISIFTSNEIVMRLRDDENDVLTLRD